MPTTVYLSLNDSPDLKNLHEIYTEIERRICELFDAPIDPDKWAFGWYDHIAGSLAFGIEWEKIKGFESSYPEMPKIIEWFENNVTIDGVVADKLTPT